MFGTDTPSWILASQIFALALFFFGGYAVFFWTPVGYVVGYLWYDYLKRRLGRETRQPTDERSHERACWLRYQRWVNASLAWRLGLESCRQRSESSWPRSVHAAIYELLSSSAPPSQVLSCAHGFAGWEPENLNRLARYVSRELTDGRADYDAVIAFLRDEQRLVDGDPGKFLGHADRLDGRFGICPFIVQKWSRDE
jgi:hypothetical protein